MQIISSLLLYIYEVFAYGLIAHVIAITFFDYNVDLLPMIALNAIMMAFINKITITATITSTSFWHNIVLFRIMNPLLLMMTILVLTIFV